MESTCIKETNLGNFKKQSSEKVELKVFEFIMWILATSVFKLVLGETE